MRLSKEAMTGRGVDRHLFASYVVAKGKDIKRRATCTLVLRPWQRH